MGVSSLENLLAPECANCNFWKNSETEYGCAYPFPIILCKAYVEAERKRKLEGPLYLIEDEMK